MHQFYTDDSIALTRKNVGYKNAKQLQSRLLRNNIYYSFFPMSTRKSRTDKIRDELAMRFGAGLRHMTLNCSSRQLAM